MTIRAAIIVLYAASIATAQVVVPVNGAHVVAAEIAAALPGWNPENPAAELAPSPLPGSPRRISRALLQNWSAAAGADPSAAPDSLLLQRRLEALTPDSAAAILRSVLVEKLGVGADELDIEVPANHPLPSPPAGELEWSLVGGGPASAEAAPLRLRWRDSAGRSGVELLTARVRRRGAWLVAARDLPARERVSEQDFRLERGFLPDYGSCYLSTFYPDRTYELKQQLKSGEPLEEKLLAPRADVARGDLLDLEVRVGGIVLRVPARAEADAGIGDRAPLKNLESGRRIVGRILSPTTAEAVLP